MTAYFANLERDGEGWLVTFPDVPEAISGGKDEADARANAQDALEVALLTYLAQGQALPTSRASAGLPVMISASCAPCKCKIGSTKCSSASGWGRSL